MVEKGSIYSRCLREMKGKPHEQRREIAGFYIGWIDERLVETFDTGNQFRELIRLRRHLERRAR